MFLIRRQVVGLAILPRSATWLQVFGLKVAKAWKRGILNVKMRNANANACVPSCGNCLNIMLAIVKIK